MSTKRWGRIRGLMAITAVGILVAGCGPQSNRPDDSAGERQPPAPQEDDAVKTVASNTRYRELDAPKSEDEYCVVRSLTDSQNRPVSAKVPIFALVRAQDWTTLKDIPLNSNDHDHGHVSACGSDVSLAGNKLKISEGDDGAFDVTMDDANGRTMTRVFRYPSAANGTTMTNAYLVADYKHCDEADADCGSLDHYDAYLYAVDMRRSASAPKVHKFVVLDLFDHIDPSEACRLERPEHAVESRDANCVVPALQPGITPPGGATSASPVADPPIVPGKMQTGSGGGYEPP